MGQAVSDVAEERGHQITVRFNSDNPLAEASRSDLYGEADVAVDFSLPDIAVDHIKRYCEWDGPAVIGTTGWYDHLPQVQSWVAESAAGVLYAANFSVGVLLLRRALEGVAPLLNALPDYDAYIHESHHRRKADSPSGTALMLAEVLLDNVERKEYVEREAQHQRINEEALHVTSTRVGEVFGRHEVGLDSTYDNLKLSHSAKNRTGFAFGAVRAAEWLRGKQGLFTLEDVVAEWLEDAS